MVYQIQQDPNWCGPTTFAVIAGYLGHGWSGTWQNQQSLAATLLGTTTNGTDWSQATSYEASHPQIPSAYRTGYPMRDALNFRISSNFYVPVALASSPSATEINTLRANLVASTDTVTKLAVAAGGRGYIW